MDTKDFFNSIRSEAQDAQAILRHALACKYWESIINIDKYLSTADILDYAICLAKNGGLKDALTILNEKESKFHSFEYYTIWANLAKSANEFELENRILHKLFDSTAKQTLKLKQAKVRYIDNAINNLELHDEARNFAQNELEKFGNDPWFLKLQNHAEIRIKASREKQIKLTTISKAKSDLITGLSYTDALNNERQLSDIVIRKDPIRIFTDDALGIPELLHTRIILNDKSDENDSLLSTLTKIRKVCDASLASGSNLEIPLLSDLHAYVNEASTEIITRPIAALYLSSEAWSILSDIFVSFGCFHAAFICRENIIDSIKSELNAKWNDSISLKLILGLLERGDFQNALEYINKYECSAKKALPPHVKNAFLFYTGKINDIKKPGHPDYKRFMSLIEGKRIAIVGPTHTQCKQGEEIDSYDFIVRNNFTSELTLDPAVYGKRTDIVYYASGIATRYHDEIKFISNKLQCLVYKFKIPLIDTQAFQRVGLIPPVFKGAANQLPIMLHDLFLANPAEIKIFCMDFHCSEKPYNPSYQHTKFNFRAYVCHEPISGLSIARAIWASSDNVKADKGCDAIFNLTNEQYAQKMEAIHNVR